MYRTIGRGWRTDLRHIVRATLWTLLVCILPVCLLVVAGAVQGQQPATQLDKTSIGGTDMPKFSEMKIGSVGHIQLRPNPLAN